MKSIEEALPLIAQSHKIFITTHYKPDGDAVGSVMALAQYLKLKGKEVYPVFPSEIPDFLSWISDINTAYNYKAETKKVKELVQNADLIFCLDFNDFSRVKEMSILLENAHQPKILIDHHLNPSNTFEYGISDSSKSSTCEMVYDFINIDGGNSLINKNIAECIYTGTMTDTGSFRFPSTTASVHFMIGDLINKGLNHSIIHEHIYDSWNENRMRFLGFVLYKKMELLHQYNTGLITISKKESIDFQLNTGDTEGLVNYPLSINNINIAVLIIEHDDNVKLSFRSKGNIDVSAIARNYFNGGGHFNASGGQSSQSFTDTILHFKKILSEIHTPN